MEEYQEHSLGGRVFQKIREDILSGKYKEHDELRETTLGKELGVSRTPVREALRQLELEGLVAIIPNKGAYVTGISQKDIKDIYVIRSMLEGLCARWAAQHISGEQLDELEEAVLLSEFQMKKGSGFNAEQITLLDGRFHTILYEASGSRILIADMAAVSSTGCTRITRNPTTAMATAQRCGSARSLMPQRASRKSSRCRGRLQLSLITTRKASRGQRLRRYAHGWLSKVQARIESLKW